MSTVKQQHVLSKEQVTSRSGPSGKWLTHKAAELHYDHMRTEVKHTHTDTPSQTVLHVVHIIKCSWTKTWELIFTAAASHQTVFSPNAPHLLSHWVWKMFHWSSLMTPIRESTFKVLLQNSSKDMNSIILWRIPQRSLMKPLSLFSVTWLTASVKSWSRKPN